MKKNAAIHKKTADSEKKHFITKLFKKTDYRVYTKGFGKIIKLMLIGGIIVAAVYGIRYQYAEYAVSKAYISLVYPQIASGEYPDGSRFTPYDLVGRERVEEALQIMQEQGKYENFTVEELCGRLYVSSDSEAPVKSGGAAEPTQGGDDSRAADKYQITFVQPHDYKNGNILRKFISKNYSDEFLNELMNINKKYIQEYSGGSGSFSAMADMSGIDSYDYAEKLAVYKTKLSSIMSYLTNLDDTSAGFVSGTTEKKFQDLIDRFRELYSQQLEPMTSLVESAGLTSDLEMMTNQLNMSIESNQWKLNELNDQVNINEYAKNTYDRTFTEKLIAALKDRETGLDQVRPETTFDHIVEQYDKAGSKAAEYQIKLNQLYAQRDYYGAVMTQTPEYAQLSETCSTLQKQFETDYLALCKEAESMVSEYDSASEEGYLTVRVTKKEKLPPKFLMWLGGSFLMGMALVFIVYVCISSLKHAYRIKKKNELLRQLRSGSYRN